MNNDKVHNGVQKAVKQTSITICCIVLISAVLSELSISPHGGVLYFIWGKYYYVYFTPLFVYYAIVVSLLWYVFSINNTSLIRKISLAAAVILLGIILTFTSAVVPRKVSSADFSYARGFPLEFYLPTENDRISENLAFSDHKYGKFPAYYLLPKPQEYAATVLKTPFVADVLFYSGLIAGVWFAIKNRRRDNEKRHIQT